MKKCRMILRKANPCDDVLCFGRYKGYPMWLVIKKEPSYAKWLLTNKKTQVMFPEHHAELIMDNFKNK